MKAQYAILFAIGTILAAASVMAVPPKPINATDVTLLPADGTPDVLRKTVAAFGKKVDKANSDAETKRAELNRQMTEGLDKAIAKAQASGDINAVLSLKDAKDQFATLTTSDVPLVKNALDFRERKTVEIETARVADVMKAAKEFNDELEKTKKDETVKGNFDSAKAIADHQEKLVAWVQTLRSHAPSSPERSHRQPEAVQTPERPVDEWADAEPSKTVVVDSRNVRGNSIGRAKQGERFVIQYESGEWNHSPARAPTESPDAVHLTNDPSGARAKRAVIIRKDNPGRVLQIIPAGTKDNPYLFDVPQDGEYAIRIYDNEPAWRPDWFGDNTGQVRYIVKHKTRRPISQISRSAPIVDVGWRTAEAPRLVVVRGNARRGTPIGSAKRGEKILIRYQSGTWTCYDGHYPKESPDGRDLRYEEHQAVVADANNPEFVFAIIPSDTQSVPFEFSVSDDSEFALRMNDGGSFSDNTGEVRYEVQRMTRK